MTRRIREQAAGEEFAARLLAWFDQHGRHDLPWQAPPDAYRIWVSEIMLQQTQVATVIGYFERFMVRFPKLESLADADIDDVLGAWSGLGYYARARHLHAAARRLRDENACVMPREIDALCALPGIGRSTGAAILAQAHGDRHAILDGNVKRVLARHAGVSGWPGQSAVNKRLWALAERNTPEERVADYTQAIMDLGATLCTRRNPRCMDCPVGVDCVARAEGRQHELPTPRKTKAVPTRERRLLIVRDRQGRVLLERRPNRGIWGGLWSLPEVTDADHADAWCHARVGREVGVSSPGSGFEHRFSHFVLRASTYEVLLPSPCEVVRESDNLAWYDPRGDFSGGIPAPVERFLSDGA